MADRIMEQGFPTGGMPTKLPGSMPGAAEGQAEGQAAGPSSSGGGLERQADAEEEEGEALASWTKREELRKEYMLR